MTEPVEGEHVRARLLGIGHGVALKGVSIAAKFLFLIAIAPRMPAGELARYLLLVTSCVIASRLLLLGLDEQLTIEVRGEEAAARRYAALAWPFVLLAGIAAGLYHTFGSEPALIVAGALVMTGAGSTASVARGLRTSAFELASNLPAVVFVATLLATGIREAIPMLGVWLASQLVVQLGVLLLLGLLSAPWRVPWRELAAELAPCIPSGLGKMGSSLLLTLQIRGLVLIPGYALGTLISDALALALMIGEAGLQVVLVAVHRNYTRYAQGLGTLRGSLAWSVGLGVVSAAVGGIVASIGPRLALQVPPSVDYTLIGWSAALMGGVAAFCEVRYYVWTRGHRDRAIYLHQVVAVGIAAGVVLGAPPEHWLPWTTLGCGAWVAVWLAWLGVRGEPSG